MERKAKPILFSGSMVRAILEGRKSQTRRIMKPQIDRRWNIDKHDDALRVCKNEHEPSQVCDWVIIKPAFEVGDLLWVRELLRRPDGDPWVYAADNQPVTVAKKDETAMLVWAHHKEQDYCPSMFMPRWASRITLEVTGVKAERLQDISEEDAKAEGASLALVEDAGLTEILAEADAAYIPEVSYVVGFTQLWHTIHKADGPNGWTANPWLWAYECRQVADVGKDQVG